MTQLIAQQCRQFYDRITKYLKGFKETHSYMKETRLTRPSSFNLTALAEHWNVEYRSTFAKTTSAQTVSAAIDQSACILVSGAITDTAACQAALCRWLIRYAKNVLPLWLEAVSQETGLSFSSVGLKNQRTRWGSCTLDGRINLNCKLLFLPKNWVRYVLIHELSHTREHNHSKNFWAIVRRFEPETDRIRRDMKNAWQYIPVWAH